jgi:hypothetical protein
MTKRTELDEIGDELARLKYQLMGIKVELKLRRLSISTKDGFDPDQPRDETGRWTDGDGTDSGEEANASENSVAAVFADFESLPLASRLEARLGEAGSSDSEPTLQPAAAKIIYSNAVTGDERIDSLTEKLSNTLTNVMNVFDFIPYDTPRAYGTAVHSAFGAAVLAQRLEGVEVEFSYKNNSAATYGEEGSVRADVALRSVTDEVIAIYDLKTGGAVVSSSRADELRSHFSASRYIPVIELHILRGSRVKHATLGTHFQYYPKRDSRSGSLW